MTKNEWRIAIPQHTPVDKQWMVLTMNHLKIHDGLAELSEFLALEGLGEMIRNHVIGWTTIDMQFFLVDAVGDEKVANIDVFCLLAAAQFGIFLEQDSSLVVLE